jgi:hypothetical protein
MLALKKEKLWGDEQWAAIPLQLPPNWNAANVKTPKLPSSSSSSLVYSFDNGTGGRSENRAQMLAGLLQPGAVESAQAEISRLTRERAFLMQRYGSGRHTALFINLY